MAEIALLAPSGKPAPVIAAVAGWSTRLAWQLVQARAASSCGAWHAVHCAWPLAASTGRPAWHAAHGLTCAASKLWGAWQPVQVGWPAVRAVSAMRSGGGCFAWQRAQP
jgi:hypothetical protein